MHRTNYRFPQKLWRNARRMREQCDGMIADHDCPAQLARWSCVGISVHWNFQSRAMFAYHFTLIWSQERRGQHVESQAALVLKDSSSLTGSLHCASGSLHRAPITASVRPRRALRFEGDFPVFGATVSAFKSQLLSLRSSFQMTGLDTPWGSRSWPPCLHASPYLPRDAC